MTTLRILVTTPARPSLPAPRRQAVAPLAFLARWQARRHTAEQSRFPREEWVPPVGMALPVPRAGSAMDAFRFR